MSSSPHPFDAEQVDHHDGLLARLRHEAPVVEIMPGMFYVDAPRGDPRGVPPSRRLPPRQVQAAGRGRRTEDQLNLGETDPPVHARVRKALAGALSPPAVRPYEPFVRAVCASLVDGFASDSSADLIAQLGAPLPAMVIGHVAGIPESGRGALPRLLRRLHRDGR